MAGAVKAGSVTWPRAGSRPWAHYNLVLPHPTHQAGADLVCRQASSEVANAALAKAKAGIQAADMLRATTKAHQELQATHTHR